MSLSTDYNRNFYSSDDNSYYASPVFANSSNSEFQEQEVSVLLEISINQRLLKAPKKLAPSLSRQSTCRPTSTLYLPNKKRKNR